MLIEHLIYSSALAIFIGMIHYKYFNRDYSWIIIASAYIPDLDMISGSLLKILGITPLIGRHNITHGDFHNVMILAFYAIFLAILLHTFGYKFLDSAIFAGIGFSAHLFEDALVFRDGYSFFFPFVRQRLGIGLFCKECSLCHSCHYNPDFYGIANKEVLIIGLILLLSSAALRAKYEGPRWIKNYLPRKA